MARYEDNYKNNLVMHLLSKGLKPDLDGKVRLKPYADEETPWVAAKVDPERHCVLWLQHLFSYFSMVPWQCTGCWKIFYKINTLKELFRVEEFQLEHDNFGLPRKCGMERRDNGGRQGGYLAFWYNPLFCGLDKARYNLKRLREALGVKELQLKRGCTEIEVFTRRKFDLGSSDWGRLVTRNSLELQRKLEDTFVHDPPWEHPHPDRVKATENLWIENAIAHCHLTGDYSFREYTDVKLPVDLEVYGDTIHSANDFVGGKDGEHYLVNLVGRREAERYFNKDLGGESGLLVPELEEEE